MGGHAGPPATLLRCLLTPTCVGPVCDAEQRPLIGTNSSPGVAERLYLGFGAVLVGTVLGRGAGVCQLAVDAAADPLVAGTGNRCRRVADCRLDVAGGSPPGHAGVQPGRPHSRCYRPDQ